MPLVSHKPRPIIAKGATVQAATGGLNAYDSLVSMPEQDATILRNFIPEPYGCSVRKGYRLLTDGFAGYVRTIMPYNSVDGTTRLFGVDDDSIKDFTGKDTVTNADDVAPSTNPWWQFTNFANAAGTHLIAFNGVDDGFWYGPDGYTALVLGDGVVEGTWKNVDPKDLVNTVVHQKRVWAVQKDSCLGWYLPPEQVYGVATSFDFGGCFSKGGYLQALGTWTTDNGVGMEDRLVAISSRGEIAIYEGIDPNSADTWKLEGVYQAGPTFTRRCWTKYGADCAILTQYGIVTMSSCTDARATESVSKNTLSYKIQKLLSDLVIEGEFRAGWQILAYPNQNLLIVNVPGVTPAGNFQLAMNTITQAWTTFLGFTAQCWTTAGASILFGGFQAVYLGLNGTTDNADREGRNGVAIRAEAQSAFNYFGGAGQNKHFKMFRPAFVYGGEFNFRARANMDFAFGGEPPPAAVSYAKYGVWDEDVWDGIGVWSGGLLNSKNWVFVNGIGYAAAIRLMVETPFELSWIATDWALEPGGIV